MRGGERETLCEIVGRIGQKISEDRARGGARNGAKRET